MYGVSVAGVVKIRQLPFNMSLKTVPVNLRNLHPFNGAIQICMRRTKYKVAIVEGRLKLVKQRGIVHYHASGMLLDAQKNAVLTVRHAALRLTVKKGELMLDVPLNASVYAARHDGVQVLKSHQSSLETLQKRHNSLLRIYRSGRRKRPRPFV